MRFVTAPNTKKKEFFVNTLKKNLKFTVLLLVSLMIVLGVPVLGYAEITAVSDRTAEVRDAIVTAAGVNTADEVTETHLAAITSLNLRSAGITALTSGDFSGMTRLTSLNLYNNELSNLPDGIFEGLTALTSVRLGGNTVDPLPITITLEKSEDGQFKAIMPTGAPFDIVLPISATNGSISDSATSLTIAKGSTESSAVTVSRTADTTAAVTANIGTLPGLPRNHYGYVLTKSDALPLEVISEVTSTTPVVPDPVEPDPVVPEPVEPDPVVPDPVVPEPETPTNTAPVFTDGSTAIRSIAENTAAGANIGTAVSATDANEDDSLTYTLGGVDAASFDIEQTTGQLKTKRALDYEMKRVYTVTISVSDGTLTDTITVIISVIDVDDTPFVSTTLAVSDRTPAVRDAIVTAIPSVSSANEVTDAHLATITTFNLRSAGITELKSGDFSGMTGLTNLNLYGNMLTTLPIGIFQGLTSLTTLRLGGNLVDPLPLIVSLQQIDAGEFQAVVHTGAPFEIVLPIGAMMVTIPKGSLTSASFTALSTPSISALPGLPANHFGYTLAKSTVYNRTQQVRDAIVAALSDVNDYRNVTEVDLATIISLNLDGKSITSLKAGDFAGMLSLTTLNLDNNQLTSLPGSIFGGLPSLTTLRLSNNQLTNLPDGFFAGIASLSELNVSGNSVSPLQLTVSLEKVGENQIKAVALAGAPFDIVLPITVANGSIDGTTLTLSTSSVESGALTVTRTPDTIAAVTVDIAMLPNLPSLHSGYALAKSNTGPLNIFSEINVAPVFTEGTTVTRTIAENTAADTNIGSAVLATDANNDTLTYSLSETDATLFSIVSTSGQLKTKATLDYETKTSYLVTVTVSDGSLTDTISVTINVTDVDENRAPVFTEGSSATRTVAENTGSGVDIGTTASATDVDNDTLSYSLGGTDADAFSIDNSSGQLRTKSALDYETQSSYSVIVTVSDGELTDSIAVTITVTDIDEDVPVDNVVGTKDDETPNNAPVFTEGSSASREVAENTGSGVNIGTAVSATDTDKDTLTYSLDGTDADSFSINSTNGQIRTSATLDYETKDSYSVTITVSDGNDGSDSISVTINITNIDESAPNNAPVFSDGASTTRTVAENTGAGVNIGSAVSATDADEDTLTYSLGGTDASAFSINSTNGQLRTNASLDYETKSSYSVSITVSDGKGGSDSISVTVNITDVDESPTNNAPIFTVGSTATRSVAENTATDTNVGSAITATDADDDTLTYSLSGNDASSFDIVSSSGQLKTKDALDHETKSSYAVTISVSDGEGGSDSIVVTINVTDVNEAPVFSDGTTTTRTIAENVGANINIGTAVKATDPDTDDSLTYTLGGTDAALFAIDDKTGQLKTKSALDYETKTSYTVTVSVSDGSLADEITVTINVRDLDETPSNIPPVFTEGDDATRTIAENTTADTNIGTPIAATDADSETLAYVLSGTEASLFSIDDETGQLKTSGALNYETKDSYTVTVTVSDGSQNDTINVTIDVTNVNDAPVFAATNDTALTIAENTAAGTNIGTAFAASDEDNDTLTFSLGGTDAGSYDIGSGSGQLKTKSALDFETKPSYSVEIVVSDGNNGSDTLEVGITVTDVDENSAPVFTDGESVSLSVAENTGSGVDIGDPVGATDADGDTLTYTLDGTDDALFSIDSRNGQLRTHAKFDYEEDETSYSVTITASDGKKSDTITVTINVTDVDENRAPVFATGNTTRSVDENTASGQNIGEPVEATDADNDTLTYTLGGTDATSFDIDTSSGQLKTDAALDYEGSKNAYSVTVTASDGTLSDMITVNINVLDVDENRAPTFTDGTSTTRSIAENTAANTNIGNAIAATDPDNDTLIYSLSGTDAAEFNIDTGSGQLKTKAPLDYEGSKNAYSVTVTASDGTLSDTITVNINVTNVNEVPTFSVDPFSYIISVIGNVSVGADIGDALTATDPDGDTLTYSVGDDDASFFSIVSVNGSGQLKVTQAFIDDTKTNYSIKVIANDGNGGIAEVAGTVTASGRRSTQVTNNTPVFTDGSSTTRSIAENTASGQNIGTSVGATDSDTGDILTYTLSGTDAASFDIVSTSGQLQTDAALNYDTKSSYTVTVTVTDDSGVASNNSATITVTINITDVDEGTSITPVSDRTPAVRDAIVAAVSGVSDPADVTAAHLADINELSIHISMRTGLPVGDFDGLTGLETLTIEDEYDIETLPSGIFDDLTSLTMLSIESTELNTLPSDIFDNLSSLTELILHDNELTSLPSGIFDNLTSLTTLDLSYNSFTSIPSGIFVNLTSLTELDLEVNESEPLLLPVSLELVQSGEFKAVAATGAPFEIVVPITVTNGTISGGATSLTISKGSVESSALTVTQNSGSTGSVSASIGTLPDIPSFHYGYEFSKGETLSVISGDNSAPVFNETGTVTRTIDEGTTQDVHIGSPVTATDADNQTLTYTLGGTDAASFSIDDKTGQLKTKAALDYETKNSYTVTVTATDTSSASNNSTTITVTITVNDIVGETSFTPVNERSPWMRDALVRSVPDVDSAEEITAVHLAKFTRFTAFDHGYSSMKSGDFDGLIGLTYLDLSGNEFTSLPAGIFDNLTALTYLDLARNELTSLPSFIFDNLTALTHLDLNSNGLTSLPSGIFDNLTALTYLDLDSNGLTSLLSGIFDNLTALTRLDLDNNELTSLPSGIFDNLTALTHLELDGNELTSLPSGIFDNLTALTTLDLARNELTSLLSGIFDNLTALTTLELRTNELSSLPSDIFDQLTALTKLELSYNELTSLPSGIFDKLTQLTWLDVVDNGLSSLTDGIFDQLTQLTDLYMGENELSSVPSGIFDQLSLLKKLRLDKNHFTSLPDGIFIGLTSLQTFFIGEQTDSNGNAVPTLSLSLELEKVADGMFKAVAPAGAPYNIKIYLTLEDGVISGGQDYITIPQGSVESGTATVTRSPSDSTNAVNVSIDRVSEPGNHTGYSASYDTQALAVIPAVGGAPNSNSKIPAVTNLLPNYPNPFNPETWIPYQLSKSSDVTFTIYNMRGVVVRELALGHKPAGYYTSKNRAAYWDGRNQLGEKVAAGVYFSTFKAADYTATRKMLIRK